MNQSVTPKTDTVESSASWTPVVCPASCQIKVRLVRRRDAFVLQKAFLILNLPVMEQVQEWLKKNGFEE